ncbi:hypothetical protein HFP43_35155 [Streptomyces sp. SJ1-7]|nr:hypothetical protein [Streptomyces sp. SJ1-7]
MLEDVLAAATTAADGAEDTAAAALKNRDLYDQDQLQPGGSPLNRPRSWHTD